MNTEHFLIKARFAHASNLPVSFVAVRVKETKKAVWVYGHGAIDPTGHCARCGRTLTHPGSILIGIGPECLGNWGARDIRLENMTKAEQEYLKSLVTNQMVDAWVPKSAIKKYEPTTEIVTVPANHKSQEVETPSTSGTTPASPVVVSKRAKEWKGVIAIQFPYNAQTLWQVKTLDGRKWHSEGKYWTASLSVSSVKKLKEWGFELDESLTKMISGNEEINPLKTPSTIKLNGELKQLKRKLFPFQEEGVQFIESRKGRSLVADEMGLGKTIQALAYLQLHPELRPAVVVCPASLKLNWAKEINETMTVRAKVQILEGKRPYNLHGEIVIINYDVLQNWLPILQKFTPKIIIADECHYFKSNSALRTKAVKSLAKGVPHFIALSGTPIVNRPIEIYNALSIIGPTVIPPFWDYARKYCGAVHNGFGWDFTGATNTQELHKILTDTIMIRRTKKEVLKDLPDKIRSFIPLTLSNVSEYQAIESDVIGYLRRVKGEKAADKVSNAEVIVQIELLKQAAVRGKLEAAVDWIKDFLDSSDEKLVVFSTHTFVVERLMEVFQSIAVRLDGSSGGVMRQKAVEEFQNNPKVRLFNGNIKAAGVGLTLTAASNVAIIEYPWTPGELTQAEDRCHRIGQKDTVNIHYLMVPGTIEEKLAKLIDSKTKVLDAVLDGKETQTESLLTELMNSLV